MSLPNTVACIDFCSSPNTKVFFSFTQACLRLSPQISVRRSDTVFIEFGKCLNLYTEATFLARVKVLLRRFKLQAKIGLARDLPSAFLRARWQVEDCLSAPIEALPDFSFPMGSDESILKTLSKMISVLQRLGITTFAQFKNLPTEALPSRFGKQGLYCKQVLNAPELLIWPVWHPATTYEESLALDLHERCREIEPLLFYSKSILDRLFSRLRGSFLRADQICFTLHIEKHSGVTETTRTFQFELISPQGSTSGFLPILRERLSRELEKRPIESSVHEICCEIPITSRAQSGQSHFFERRSFFEEEMGSFFGQIEEYLGKGYVFWATPTEERLPEKSWRKIAHPLPSQLNLNLYYPKRPTRLFKTPIPITVLENRISFQGRVFKTVLWSEVERLALNWIEHEPARNYYQVDLESGTSIWVFSDPSHHFFLHGYFE